MSAKISDIDRAALEGIKIPLNELSADRCDEASVGHGHIMLKGYIELPSYPSKIWRSKTNFESQKLGLVTRHD